MLNSILGLIMFLTPLLVPVPQQELQPVPHANVRSPHGSLSTPCENCHTYSAWKPIRNIPEFNHNKTKFPLLGMHQSVTCTQCHTKLVFSKAGTKCSECHADIHRGQFGSNCERCHSEKGWQVSTKEISQHFNRFPLTGAHAMQQCDSCHRNAANGQFQGLSTDCYSCHQRDYLTPVIDHKALNFPVTCQDCHNMNSFAWAKFDHLKYTGFALTGVHATLTCTDCHTNGNYKGTPASCFGCHQKDFSGTNNPNHTQAGFPTTCSTCHNTTNWTQVTFDHATYAHYALTGKHATLQCTQCHVNNNYSITSTACYSCHATDYNGTTNPNHKSLGFPTDCSTCHSTSGWSPATFNHNSTGFPLTGAHAALQCTQCHANGNFNITNTACYSCHQADYNGTTNPNHVAGGYPTNCTLCHTTTAWSPASFNHASTGFALTGAHTSLQCAQCHVNGNYNLTSAACYSCHQKDYTGTTNPNHVQAGFPTDCTVCHTTAAWTPATFNHASTGFALTGAHATLQCAQCHVNGNYNLTSTACYSCHQTDFSGTNNPNHLAAGFPTDCTVCHNTSNWTTVTFDHATYAHYALTGQHATLQCVQCHANNNYNITTTACYSCHQADYNGTTNPNHKQAGFPTDCSVCHTTAGWTPASFNHSQTGFPLTGAHTTLQCAACHVNGNYNLTSAACYSCHQADYTGTTNPNHVQAGFPTDCTVCHTTTAWSPSSFNHANTGFALTGAHATLLCSACHLNGNYTTAPPTDCYSCHSAEYKSTTNPNHVAANFPTTCGTCHTTATWLGAVFNHTWFPIYSGTHNGKWTTCADCHISAADYSIFSCITCHQHAQANTDPNHQGVRNYVYSATSCYSCHPTGNGG